MHDETIEETESMVSDPAQHYSAPGIDTAEQEEAYQSAVYDAFFNSDADDDMSSYALTDSGSVSEQLVITNALLTYSLAVNIMVYLLIIAGFVIRFLRSIITKIF